MKSKKRTWSTTVAEPQLSVEEEMKLWYRIEDSGNIPGFLRDPNADPKTAEINPLRTTLQCICGNHPWTAPGLSPGEMVGIGGPMILSTVAGPPRTGSTLVYNTLKLIIETGTSGKVRDKHLAFKTHELFESRCPWITKQDFIFYCIRNPFDSLYSYLRMNNLTYDDITESNVISTDWYDKIYTDAKLARIHSDLYHNKLTKQLFMSAQERPLLIVPYEEYWNNERKLIEDISRILQIKLTEEQKQEIYSKINIKIAKNVSDELNEGESYRGLHRAHVGDQNGAPGQGVNLPRFIKEDIIQKFGNIYLGYGYKLKP